MFLSKLTLNPRDRDARRDLSNPYDLHSSLKRTIPDGRFLWRLENTRTQGSPVVLVQHAGQPEWAALSETYLDAHDGVQTRALELAQLLQSDRLLRFRVCANPTITRFDPIAQKNKRHGLMQLEEQLDWLDGQFMRSGLEPVGFTVSSAERMVTRKRSAERPITVLAVTFDGHARVREPDAARGMLEAGIGHAKALGLGLVSIAPVR
jgi:CRISPR system Cascade subunit CasE